MAIVDNAARVSLPANPIRFVDYGINAVDPHLNTVNTGCGTDIVGIFPTTDDRGNPTTTTDFFDGVTFVSDIPDQNIVVDEPFTYNTAPHFTTDGDSALVYTSTPLNTGLVLDADSGVISGIPTVIGANSPIVTATNDDGTDDSNAFTITAS